jgi:hypothetical protein
LVIAVDRKWKCMRLLWNMANWLDLLSGTHTLIHTIMPIS